MRVKLFNALNLANLLIAIIVFGYVAQEIWLRSIEPRITKTAEVHSFKVLTDHVYPGDVIRYKIEYSKYREVAGLAIKEAVAIDNSGDEYVLMGDSTNVEMGYHRTSTRLLRTPDEILPNVYKIRATWEWPPVNDKSDPVTLKVYSDNTFTVLPFPNKNMERGERGLQGQQGMQGIPGKQGPQGNPGPRGERE
jgi:hypothetical protein